MNRLIQVFLFFLICLTLTLPLQTIAQGRLTDFKVIERNGLAIVGWINQYRDLTQMIIQRSSDSAEGFRSIISMPDPNSATNGYVDRKANGQPYYYRLFYVFQGGRYAFTPAKRAEKNNSPTAEMAISSGQNPFQQRGPLDLETFFKTNPDLATRLKRESSKGKIKPASGTDLPAEDLFTPSAFIYTNTEGNLMIALPDVSRKKFSLRVFKSEKMPVFEMKHIREPQLLIDKSNFLHSGWFSYELFEGDRLKERNRFFIPPELK
jgi:hypothetical protein